MTIEKHTFFKPPQITDQASYAEAWQQAAHVLSPFPEGDPVSEIWFQALSDAEIKLGLVDDREKLRRWRRGEP